ncbi:MAG: glycosyltransferase [Planctomycetota bacterium]
MMRKTPLKCVFVITSMPVGGAETLLVNLMRRFDPTKVRPEIVCLKEPGPLGEQIAEEFPVHSGLLRSKYDLMVVPRLVHLFRTHDIDGVITVGAGDKMFWGRLAAFLARVPVTASALHSTGWPDGVGRLNRLLTPLTDAFIAVADAHGEFLRSFERFPAEKVRVIRNGIDCQRFQHDRAAARDVRLELGIAPETPLVGIVAALRPEKNHPLLLDAAARLRNAPQSCPAPEFLIIGDGPERDTIANLRDDLGLTDHVHMLGNRSDTPRLLSALDVFALCSFNEASPVSILEALACETPVVATNVGSISETVLDEKTGFLVPSGDAARLASAIDNLLKDPEKRQMMGRQGRQHVLATGSLQSMVESYESLVGSIFRRHASFRPGLFSRCTRGAHAVTQALLSGLFRWRRKTPTNI